MYSIIADDVGRLGHSVWTPWCQRNGYGTPLIVRKEKSYVSCSIHKPSFAEDGWWYCM